jgi:hypothetical protein
MINEKIFLGFPLDFKDVCKVYPPTVNDMCGDEKFEFCQTLFMMTQEDLEDAYVNENVPTIPTPFQYLLMNVHQDDVARDNVLHGFQKLLHEPVTIVPELEVIIIGKSEEELDPDKDLENPRVIDAKNYFDFQNIVRTVLGAQPAEPPVEDEDPKIRRYKAKIRASERLLAKKKKGTNFGTLIAAICCMGIGLTPLNIGEISYACVPWLIGMSQQKEEYDIDIRALLAGADKKKVKPKYWIKDLNEEI